MENKVAIQSQEIKTDSASEVIDTQQQDLNTLILTVRGSAKVDTGAHVHNTLAKRLLFVPHGNKTTLSVSEKSLVYIFSIDPQFNNFPLQVTVHNCSPLAQEILVHFHLKETPMEFSQRTKDLYALVFSDKGVKDPFHLSIPMPSDPRGRKCYEVLINGNLKTSHEKIAQRSGASKRTLERIFQNDLGMTFSKWRQQVRIQQSLILLHKGYSIAEVTSDVGYASTSSFIHSFKEILDISPGQYIRQHLQKVVENSE